MLRGATEGEREGGKGVDRKRGGTSGRMEKEGEKNARGRRGKDERNERGGNRFGQNAFTTFG